MTRRSTDPPKATTRRRRVSLMAMRPYLEELEARAGSARAASRAVGTTPSLYLAWQGRSPYHESHRPCCHMNNDSAARVLQALRDLREDQAGVAVITAPHTRNGRLGRCTGCGTALDCYTEGCRRCIGRRATRALRERREHG